MDHALFTLRGLQGNEKRKKFAGQIRSAKAPKKWARVNERVKSFV